MNNVWNRFFSDEQFERVKAVMLASGFDGVYDVFGLLFIEPKTAAAREPVLDEATRRMTAAFRKGESAPWCFGGVHTCICGAASEAHDYLIHGGYVTNSLCIHYMAYHRAEVTAEELQKVLGLMSGMRQPRPRELKQPRPEIVVSRRTILVPRNRTVEVIKSSLFMRDEPE